MSTISNCLYIALHYITLHCIALHCVALHCIALNAFMRTYIHYILFYNLRISFILHYFTLTLFCSILLCFALLCSASSYLTLPSLTLPYRTLLFSTYIHTYILTYLLSYLATYQHTNLHANQNRQNRRGRKVPAVMLQSFSPFLSLDPHLLTLHSSSQVFPGSDPLSSPTLTSFTLGASSRLFSPLPTSHRGSSPPLLISSSHIEKLLIRLLHPSSNALRLRLETPKEKQQTSFATLNELHQKPNACQ